MSGPSCPSCGGPRIPWPGRSGIFCVHGHGVPGLEPAVRVERQEQFGYRFGIDLSKLGVSV